MIRVGDPVLIVVRGPYGAGFVKAIVEHVYESPGIAITYSEGNFTTSMGLRYDSEGLTWTRGHDESSPEAQALLTVLALS